MLHEHVLDCTKLKLGAGQDIGIEIATKNVIPSNDSPIAHFLKNNENPLLTWISTYVQVSYNHNLRPKVTNNKCHTSVMLTDLSWKVSEVQNAPLASTSRDRISR